MPQSSASLLPKKLVVIQDMAGVGRCSMTVALPIISACKVQACPVPTSIFSNHTGFPTFYKKDLSDSMEDYLSSLSSLPIRFDGVYCGYLGSTIQIKIVSNYIKHMIKDKAFVVIDPVMGDHGKRYTSITEDFCIEMKRLLPYATILTPNITEACLLTDTPYQDGLLKEEDLITICNKLQNMGANKIIITGMKNESHFYNYLYENETSNLLLTSNIAGESRPGTGDIFASIVAALSLRGFSLEACVKKAASFIETCTKASSLAKVPTQEGVIFEQFLGDLLT